MRLDRSLLELCGMTSKSVQSYNKKIMKHEDIFIQWFSACMPQTFEVNILHQIKHTK
jgi:hypothetical protein